METKDIKHLAALARIRISESEAESLKTDIESVLEYVSVVSDIAATDGALTKKLTPRFNVFRPDEVTNVPGSFTNALMAEAPATEGRLLKVKKILNQD